MSSPDLERQCERYARLKLWLAAFEYLLLLGTLASLTLTSTAGRWIEALSVELGAPYQVMFV